jgi:hypothetical protein
MSTGTLPDGGDEYRIPEAADQLVVEIKAHAERVTEIKRLFALRRIVTEIAEDDPDGLLNTEIGITNVWPPTVVIRLWWADLETLEAWRRDASPYEWIWGAFQNGTWGTAFKQHVYTIGKPTASPYSPPKDHAHWQQEVWE